MKGRERFFCSVIGNEDFSVRIGVIGWISVIFSREIKKTKNFLKKSKKTLDNEGVNVVI